MNIAGGENFYYKRIGGLGSQTPVKVFKGNGYHYYEDPKTGQRRFLDPTNGTQIKDKTQIEGFNTEIKNTEAKKAASAGIKNQIFETMKKNMDPKEQTEEFFLELKSQLDRMSPEELQYTLSGITG